MDNYPTRKPHFWHVGFQGDLNSQRITVGGKELLAIPYTPSLRETERGHVKSYMDQIEVFAGKARGLPHLQMTVRTLSHHDYKELLVLSEDQRFMAHGCRPLKYRELHQVCHNSREVQQQLGLPYQLDMMLGQPDVKSGVLAAWPAEAHVRTVHLLVARNAPSVK